AGVIIGAAAAVVLAVLVAGGVLVWHAVAGLGGTPQPTQSTRQQGLQQGVPGASSPATSSAPTGPAAPAGLWYGGTWVGAANQPNGVVTHWTARVTFPATGGEGTFVFPTMGCSGTLIVTVSGPTAILANEQVTSNPRGLCAPRGLLALVKSGANAMNLAWQDASDKKNVAFGHLVRSA
ncbi:MAG TPA: hypothetical protein VGR98_01850, partial [Streptosporangiaceae bacterium]|nr:hypothetical protein [Streptosporangiaceae bacterium]